MPRIAVQVYSMESHRSIPASFVARYRLLGLGGGMTGLEGGGCMLQQRREILTNDIGEANAEVTSDGEITVAAWPEGFRMTVLDVGRVPVSSSIRVVARRLDPSDRIVFKKEGRVLGRWRVTIADITRRPEIAFDWALGDDGAMPGGMFQVGHKYLVHAVESVDQQRETVMRGFVFDSQRELDLRFMLGHEELIR